MVNLFLTEVLKLKRSSMFLISILGAAVAPFVVVIATYLNEPSILFKELFYNVNLYTVLIIGVPLYGVVTTYLFNREYMENTLKNILAIPVSRIGFIVSKMLLLFIWIMMLTLIAWTLTLVLGMLTQFDGLSISLVMESLSQFSIGGMFLFILSTPIILVTLVMKNYVPTIIFTVVITLINVMGGNSEHRALFPWAAAGDIANNTLPLTYPPEYSYIAITATALAGFIAMIVYFNKTDIH
ncbi:MULTISPECIES: ABC transporter permease [Staphylococcus]|uniref:Bacitracin ABC transporter, permease n=2 Tax=unclassified Staphylococcus TaxID=91994 RepID=D2JDM9_9STAP|nr:MULTISPECIES: ABC transporter permease [Staphylococcus]ADA62686.1 bacitracin ABC transporter, permease [Staphylococcus sp. 693-7]MCQ9294672.1 ABC transporter permease [Staphylococcus cohnii]ASC51675.1 bacitracin ABC transporter permease [Staphylococcus aureus]NEF64123.1 ABC transporter permease [Staphylococcus aureus]PAG82977.1 bacitracin ABC transporter permease [Staphylococcus aureus]